MKIPVTALFLITCCLLLSSTCEKDKAPFCTNITMNNTTDKPLCIIYSLDYPDTSLNFQNPLINPNARKMGPHSTMAIDPEYNCLEQFLDNPGVQKLSLFVFDTKFLMATPWSQVRQNYLVYKRFDLTKDDLRNNNYTFDLQ